MVLMWWKQTLLLMELKKTLWQKEKELPREGEQRSVYPNTLRITCTTLRKVKRVKAKRMIQKLHKKRVWVPRKRR